MSTQLQLRKPSQTIRLAVLPQSQTFGYYTGFSGLLITFVHHRDKQSKSGPNSIQVDKGNQHIVLISKDDSY